MDRSRGALLLVALSACGFATLFAHCAVAQSDQAAASVMRLIANDWQRAILEGRWYVTHCADDTFAMERFSPDVTVSVDAQRSNSVMSPFVGIVELRGSLETNGYSPAADGTTLEFGGPGRPVCYRTVAEARAATSASDISPRSNGNSFTIRATYAISPDGARLSGGNEFFENILGEPLGFPENLQTWAAVIFRTVPSRQSR